MQWQQLLSQICLKLINEIIRESLLTFSGLPHRLENFLKIQGVNYINDSKATNVNAAYFALRFNDFSNCMDRRRSR